mgnify:FL=1
MEKTKKIGFFKRLKMAIFELENYIQFISEKSGKAIFYSLKLVIILSFIIVAANAIFVYAKYNNPTNYLDNIVPNFVYQDSKLEIDKDDLTTDEKKSTAEVMKQLSPSIKEIFSGQTYSKTDLMQYVQENERNIVIIGVAVVFIEGIFDLFIFWIMIAILTSFIGWIVLKFLRIKMKYSRLYALSTYASTLSIILTVIYTMLNTFFGVYIDVFDYLSMLISYIYITAVIYMIKSDLIKQQLELIRIATVQAQVKEQLDKEKEKEEEEKRKKQEEPKDEKENGSDEDSDKKEKEKSDGENNVYDDEPDGSEI